MDRLHNISTSDLLNRRKALQRKLNTTGQLSVKDTLIFKAVTESLDSRFAR